jgi:hypothetical protein
VLGLLRTVTITTTRGAVCALGDASRRRSATSLDCVAEGSAIVGTTVAAPKSLTAELKHHARGHVAAPQTLKDLVNR